MSSPSATIPEIVKINDRWGCPIDGCDKSYDKLKSLRKHCQRIHHTNVEVKRDRVELSIDDKRARQRLYTATFRAKQAPRRSSRTRSTIIHRDLFDTEDADKRGTYRCRDALVEHRPSKIPNAGNGLFAMETLLPGDIVTWYAGERSPTPTDDRAYTIALKSGYLIGIQVPKRNQGLGSFVNREDRTIPNARKNCEFMEYQGSEHYLYVEIIKTIKKDDELYCTYSRGYRIPK